MYATMRENAALDAARRMVREAAGRSGPSVDTSMLEEQVCAEAGLWEPAVARRAIDQSRGDIAQAVSMVRVWAATQPHLPACPVDPADIAVLRRLTSAYPSIPGGQWLGLAPELAPRQLDWASQPREHPEPTDPEPTDCEPTDPEPADPEPDGAEPDGAVPSAAATPRVRDLIDGARMVAESSAEAGQDPAGTVLTPPYSRATRLAMLARGETGALVALAALILGHRQEAVMVELRTGVAGIRIPHPRTGTPCLVAEVPISEVDVVLDADVDGSPGLASGWGGTLGTVERRAIALALLDAAMRADGDLHVPLTLDEQTVIAATDGPACTGFVEHLRLPHYATFTAYIAGVTGKAL
ncbi:carbon-phosphorus lyase complex subunit PhnI [Mycolicibacterium sp.]|uniref:carbon-phosphorus lyase complex subunit PhnI n=1 Tax=Mycolicibacterium sp. TaxID=2320850 RepID=UPI003D0BAE69